MSVQSAETMQSFAVADGSAFTVRSGTLLTFVQSRGGRRIPLAAAEHGMTVSGPHQAGDLSLVGVPMLGCAVADLDAAGSSAPVDEPWLMALAKAAVDDRWPVRIIPLERADFTLTPGEAVVNDEIDVRWVRVTNGYARFVGSTSATVTSADGAIPLPFGSWLEAGLRCTIAPAEPSDNGSAVLTRLAMQAVADRWDERESRRQARVEGRAEIEHAAIVASVTTLTAAVEPATVLAQVGPEVAPAVALAHANGMQLDGEQLRRVDELIGTGADPVEAVAMVVSMSVRTIHLGPGWHRQESDPALVLVADGSARKLPVILQWKRRTWHATNAITGEHVDLARIIELDSPVARELQPQLPSVPQRLADLARLAFRGAHIDAVYVVLASVVAAVLAYFAPILLGRVAGLLEQRAPVTEFAALFMMLTAMMFAGAMWAFVQSIALLRIRARASARSAIAVWERLIRQSARWHAENDLGKRSTQAGAVNSTSVALPDASVVGLLNLVTIIGSVGAVLHADPTALVLIVLLLAVQAIIAFALLRKSTKHLTASFAESAAASGLLVETLRAMSRLRVAGAESRAFLRWSKAQSKYLRSAQSMRMTTMLDGVIRAVWPTLILAALVFGIGTSGGTFGQFITAQTAATTATATLATAISTIGIAIMARRTLEQAAPVLAGIPESDGAGEHPGVISGGFRMADVRFGYPNGPTIVNGVSLAVNPGEHVALVGASGCGKTTIMRLLLGLETPQSGVVTCDGHNLAALDRTALRKQIGSVFQSSQLLPGSLRDNIAMGRVLTTAEIWAALDAASLGDDIRQMPMGLDTQITDGGGTLSGGQQQRVLIARALAGGPRVLVLDEATSALDNQTQRAVVESLESLKLTRIVVAHRLSTIRHADRIIVMEGGAVADSGTYDELVQRPGLFQDLVRRQQLEAST